MPRGATLRRAATDDPAKPRGIGDKAEIVVVDLDGAKRAEWHARPRSSDAPLSPPRARSLLKPVGSRAAPVTRRGVRCAGGEERFAAPARSRPLDCGRPASARARSALGRRTRPRSTPRRERARAMDPTPAPDPSSPPFPPADVPTRPRSALGGAVRDLADPRARPPRRPPRARRGAHVLAPRALPQDHAPLERLRSSRAPRSSSAPRSRIRRPLARRSLPAPPSARPSRRSTPRAPPSSARPRGSRGGGGERNAVAESLLPLRRFLLILRRRATKTKTKTKTTTSPHPRPLFHRPPPPDFDAAWASHAPSPMDAAVDGRRRRRGRGCAAARARCEMAPRALASRVIGETDVWRARTAATREFSSCASAQELGDDEIDRRVNAAAAAERERSLAQAAAERELQKRLKKRRLDAEYRERKRQKKALERREARIAAGLPPDSPPRAPKPPKPPKPAKPPKPQKPPPPPPKPPRFYPETFIRCESAACGKWRRVPRRVKSALCPARDRWTCAFDRSPWVAPEERTCDRPSEWASDAERLEWAEAHERAEREARALGADVDGDEGRRGRIARRRRLEGREEGFRREKGSDEGGTSRRRRRRRRRWIRSVAAARHGVRGGRADGGGRGRARGPGTRGPLASVDASRAAARRGPGRRPRDVRRRVRRVFAAHGGVSVHVRRVARELRGAERGGARGGVHDDDVRETLRDGEE